MRIGRAAVLAALLLGSLGPRLAAQATGDRSQLVFTISGAYIGGTGLWSVPAQPLSFDEFTDNLTLSRSISSTFGAALGGTYYAGDKLGLTAEAFLMGLGYDDSCFTSASSEKVRIVEICNDIDRQEKSAAAVALSVGGIYRVASREFISPFARASVGLLLMNQSSVLTQGESSTAAGRSLTIIYQDDTRSRVRPAVALGIGATMVLSRGYHLRWEVRDNIVGIERVTGPVQQVNQIPPHETAYKHLFSVFIGLDVILERERGRRY